MKGSFMKSSEYTVERSIKRYEVRFVVSINKESQLWKDTALGDIDTSSVVDITLDIWCNQSRKTYRATYMV